MEENNSTLISYAKNLGKLNFTSVISVSVDANANIKTVLDAESYLFDTSVECVSGKMVVSGKIGVRVLYIDTDNISNTVGDSQSFSETLSDSSITADSIINICNQTANCNIVQTEGGIKINCEVTIMPIMYLNLGLNNNLASFENIIVKKSEISTCAIDSQIDTNFDYTINLESKDNVAKILVYNAHFTPTSIKPAENLVIVEGKIFSRLVYETMNDGESEIKELCNNFTIKTDVPANNITSESMLDVSFVLDRAKTTIDTEIDDGNNVVVIKHNVKMCGVSFRTISIDLVDDMYSVENELELSVGSRDFSHATECSNVEETVSGEISIEDNEPAIEAIVSNINILPEITNSYLKDGELVVEGIISSQLIYLDENKEYKNKSTQLPFIINTKIKLEKLDCLHSSISIVDCKAKAKRGTIVELDYDVEICVCAYVCETKQMIDNFTLSKPLNFGEYDYQIFVAKSGETMWEICKRIKISPDDMCKYNKDLPQLFEGGEKIIIKRG